jgi:hypothetical protein
MFGGRPVGRDSSSEAGARSLSWRSAWFVSPEWGFRARLLRHRARFGGWQERISTVAEVLAGHQQPERIRAVPPPTAPHAHDGIGYRAIDSIRVDHDRKRLRTSSSSKSPVSMSPSQGRLRSAHPEPSATTWEASNAGSASCSARSAGICPRCGSKLPISCGRSTAAARKVLSRASRPLR